MSKSRPTSSSLLHRLWVPLGGGLLGCLLVFHPTLRSGFSRVLGWPDQDPRLISFTLEHGYRWLSGATGHGRLWSPPIFFPLSDVATYTEPLLAVGPLYWPWRAFGFSELTAYQLWLLAVFALNYLAGFTLLRRSFGTSSPAATAGAVVFAFGSSRTVSLTKSQLIPYFFLVLALMALVEIFRGSPREASQPTRRAWITLFFAALVAQFYTAFYPFYFFILGLLVALVWATCLPSLRQATWSAIRQHALTISICSALGLLAIWPLASRYVTTAGEVGLRIYDTTKITQWFSWSLMGSSNWMYGWVDRLPRFRPWSRSIHQNGLGMVTVLLAAIGLYRARRSRVVVLIVLTAATLFVLSVRIYDDVSLWRWVRVAVPGGEALRAVARIGNLFVFPTAIGLALFFDQQSQRTSAMLLVPLALFCFAEQAHREMSFDKVFLEWRVARIAEQVPAGCRAFFLATTGGYSDIDVQDDSMWVALETGVPAVNGRSGNVPPGWELDDVHFQSPEERRDLEAKLGRWLDAHGVARQDVCWVEIDRERERADWLARGVPSA